MSTLRHLIEDSALVPEVAFGFYWRYNPHQSDGLPCYAFLPIGTGEEQNNSRNSSTESKRALCGTRGPMDLFQHDQADTFSRFWQSSADFSQGAVSNSRDTARCGHTKGGGSSAATLVKAHYAVWRML